MNKNHISHEYRPGDRIEMVFMPNDPNPIPPGDKGEVKKVLDLPGETILEVEWDSGRGLNILLPVDKIKKLS